ncbi:SPP1 family phage portal protein [Evansella vedderi]|uniref:SPP1 family phage portal protein n=1 Tax=Evansella vedderi TaxID=38282 RepID=A0ABT9ZVM6_9BACI|nr:phage portal protein [Evansella vedderi]MDQ0254919.1 SPP1 family phage portal protein [Evansella vedderi]
MKHIIRQIKNNNGLPTAKVIKQLIEEKKGRHKVMRELYERYKAEIGSPAVPIFNRKLEQNESANKINNKLNNDFFGEIVDTKVGYLVGKPISYVYDPKEQVVIDAIRDFNLINNIEDLDSETVKKAAICGYAARQLYVDREGQERVKNINPWECVFITDGRIAEPEYAFRYYTIEHGNEEVIRVEWFNEKHITYYILRKDALEMDPEEPVNPYEHLFDYCTLFGIANNDELQGDAEKVLSLIDAYDRALSDCSSEIEQFRLAYMLIVGMDIDEEILEQMKRTGAIQVDGEPDAPADAKFITKDINDTFIQNTLDRFEENIIRFARHVNFNDEAFGGNASGVAIRYKLMNLENKCITGERKFSSSLRYQYKVLGSAWGKKSIHLDHLEMEYQFSRNLPVNLKEEAETTALLRGHVSENTRLSKLSFVPDPQQEKEEMEKEEAALVGTPNRAHEDPEDDDE